jgi:hypothetical protein
MLFFTGVTRSATKILTERSANVGEASKGPMVCVASLLWRQRAFVDRTERLWVKL